MEAVERQDKPETLEDIAHSLDTLVEPDNGDERRLSDSELEMSK